jgi:hypothetical protein
MGQFSVNVRLSHPDPLQLADTEAGVPLARHTGWIGWADLRAWEQE